MRIIASRPNIKIASLVFAAFLSFLIIACNPSAPDSEEESDQSSQQSNQQSNQSNQSAASNSLSSDEACEAFAGIGGLGGIPGGFANFMSSAQGGPTIQANYSGSAGSDEARALSGFFEDALEEALGGGVSAQCFWEVSATEGSDTSRGIWVSLKLPSTPDSDDINEIQSVLSAKGATVAGTFNNSTQGQSSAMIIVSDLPLDIEGETGGMLMISDEFAVLVTGQDSSSSSSQSSQQPGSQSSSPSSTSPASPNPTPTRTPVRVPSVNVQGISGELEDSFEDALGIDLIVESSFQSSSAQGLVVLVTFKVDGGGTIPADAADSLEDVAKSRGATITSKFSSQGTSLVTFEGFEIEDAAAMGSFTVVQDQSSLVANLTVQ